MKPRAFLLVCTVLLSLALSACGGAPKVSEAGRFELLDRNKDGVLSVSEALAFPGLAARFEAADRDGDGRLSRAEFLQYFAPQSSVGGR
jgi:hypothetical protein